MSTTEARRLDLYNALTEFLGAERADTLMAYLPTQETVELATRSDIDRVETAVGEVNRRLDRLFLTMAGGLIAMIVAVFAQAFL
jgi:hypothetical protein